MKKILTSESVNIGHPDKTCDIIADSFLDFALEQDPNSQMAVECAIKNDTLYIYGEATTKAKIDYAKIARNTLLEIGYKNKFKIVQNISKQSIDINNAVNKEELAANDQGIIFGYATDETPEFLPLPIVIAHKIMSVYENFRKTTDVFFPDAKSQVSIEYEDDKPNRITTILISVSHSEKIACEEIKKVIRKNVIDVVLEKYKKYVKEKIALLINPSGKFTIWGSFSDSGCVGRKICVDSYGGLARVGGGCFSSKNATKVDRSAAYYARYVAKNVVANKLASRFEIQLAYAIGLFEPVGLFFETFNTEKISISEIEDFIIKNFSFRVKDMIKELELLRPIYKQTACYGHFGRDEFPWEIIKKLTTN